MRKDTWNVLLVGLLLAASISAAVLAYTYSNYKRRVSQLEVEYYRINQDMGKLQSLVNDVGEYSKKNPAIMPILRDFQERFRAGPVPADATK